MSNKISAGQIEAPERQGWGIVHMKQGDRTHPGGAHSHPYDEYVFILNGRCILSNAGEETEYRKGDIGHFPHHQFHNSVEALEDTSYIWTRGDTLPEFSREPQVVRSGDKRP